ncbi:MAG: sigma-70 family RNA polymerase sigma factor [Clostridia bacterium]|nr:sigma-70 family RNA polymerase sigma factor [Clostridia bacterium]
MKKIKFFIEDITFEHIEFCDKYIKKTISNQKHKYYRSDNLAKKYDVIFVDLDCVEEEITCVDSDLEAIGCIYLRVKDVDIPVHNHELAKVLIDLTDKQRTVVLRNIVLGETLTEIAKDLGFSVSMARKLRNKALKNIKERMSK